MKSYGISRQKLIFRVRSHSPIYGSQCIAFNCVFSGRVIKRQYRHTCFDFSPYTQVRPAFVHYNNNMGQLLRLFVHSCFKKFPFKLTNTLQAIDLRLVKQELIKLARKIQHKAVKLCTFIGPIPGRGDLQGKV